MKSTLTLGLWGVLLAATLGLVPTSCAEETIASGYDRRLAELEAEVRHLREQQFAPAPAAGSPCCCCAPHVDFGAELTLLAPHSTTGLGPSGFAAFPSVGLSPGHRAWLGYTRSDGVGLRGRYWGFDHFQTNNLNNFTYDLDAFMADLELTYELPTSRQWDILFSGGVRYFDFQETRSTFAIRSEMTGLVVGGEFRRTLTGCLRAYGIARAATVFGDLNGNAAVGAVSLENRHAFLWESQLGLEYVRDSALGELSLRLGAEVMHWDSATYKSLTFTSASDESIGLIGLVTGVTLRR